MRPEATLREVGAERQQRIGIVLRAAHAGVVQADHLRECTRDKRGRGGLNPRILARQYVPREANRLLPIVQHQVAVVLVRSQRGRIGSAATRVHEVATKQRSIDRQGHVETGERSLARLD